jgi:hypothetical protein
MTVTKIHVIQNHSEIAFTFFLETPSLASFHVWYLLNISTKIIFLSAALTLPLKLLLTLNSIPFTYGF